MVAPNAVSIPEGAIEGVSGAAIWGISAFVSIPEGAIEGVFASSQNRPAGRFQYPKVRLKARKTRKHKRVALGFNTRRCD